MRQLDDVGAFVVMLELSRLPRVACACKFSLLGPEPSLDGASTLHKQVPSVLQEDVRQHEGHVVGAKRLSTDRPGFLPVLLSLLSYSTSPPKYELR